MSDLSKITIGGNTYGIKDATARKAIETLSDPSTRYVLANAATTTPTGAIFTNTYSDGTETYTEGQLVASNDTYGPIYLVRQSEYNESSYQEWITIKTKGWFNAIDINVKNYANFSTSNGSFFSTNIYVPKTANVGFIFKIHRNGATNGIETITVTKKEVLDFPGNNISDANTLELITFTDVNIHNFLEYIYGIARVDVPTLSEGENFTLHIEVGQIDTNEIYAWEMLGSSSGANVDNLGDFAYANTGYVDVTPSGSVTSTFKGENKSVGVTGTIPQKSLSMNSLSVGGMSVKITAEKTNASTNATYTPSGTVSTPSITMNSSTVSIVTDGSVSAPTFTGKYIYAKSGTVGFTSTGTASVSVPNSVTVDSVSVGTTNVNNVATSFNAGTLPSLSTSYNAESETLVISFNTGTLPSATNVTIKQATGSGTATAKLANTDKSISLSVSGSTSYQPELALSESNVSKGTQLQGTISKPIFTGATVSGTFTPTVNSISGLSFTGDSVNITGTADAKNVTPSGTVTIGDVSGFGLSVSYTPSGTVTSTFNGIPANFTVYPNN